MYCKKCHFIIRGNAKKCPYCGEPYGKLSFFDKKFLVLNNTEITIKQLIDVILINIFFVALIIDILCLANDMILHLSPWFLFASSICIIIFDYITSKNEKKMLLEILFYSVIFSLLMIFSYKDYNIWDMSIYILILGYYLPSIIILIESIILLFIIIKRKFDLFFIFFIALMLLAISTVLLVFTLLNIFELKNNSLSLVLNLSSSSLTFFLVIDYIIFSVYRIKTRNISKR